VVRRGWFALGHGINCPLKLEATSEAIEPRRAQPQRARWGGGQAEGGTGAALYSSVSISLAPGGGAAGASPGMMPALSCASSRCTSSSEVARVIAS
jgi:hypothetical protein